MGEKTERLKREIISSFPDLKADSDFKISSPETPNYNCIAWAYKSYDDRIMWPWGSETKTLDGFHYWPEGVADSTDVSAFIHAFQLQGYEVCDQWEHEKDYVRIALYVIPNTPECTHASRELRNGKWTSKLGPENDIEHGSPYSLEGVEYGKVFCIMKRLFS